MEDPPEIDHHGETDRHHLDELIQELRLVLPGTTVLFGFLLSLPFSSVSATLTTFERVVYFIAFLGAGLAMVCLIAEAGYHRLRGRPYDKQAMIRTTSHQAIAALVALGISLISCVILIANFIYGPTVALAVATPLGIGSLWMWFGLPLWRRLHGDPPAP
jgi:predicted membrane channel-forming protein YqfA (hemolysin III family)